MDAVLPIAKPTPEQLQVAFSEIDALTSDGHFAAALVRAWAALEALARLARVDSEASRTRAFSPIQAIQILAEEGYIDNTVADRLREMAKLRNAVVHGDLSAIVSSNQVQDLLVQLRTIQSEVMAVTSGEASPAS